MHDTAQLNGIATASAQEEPAMCFFLSLIPATILVVIGYFVMFAAVKAEDHVGIGTFGRVLAIWIFLIAAFPPVAGIYATFSGTCPVTQTVQ